VLRLVPPSHRRCQNDARRLREEREHRREQPHVIRQDADEER
jgi:hypothetical protein